MPPKSMGNCRAYSWRRQIEGIDTPVASEVFLARLKLAQGDVAGAAVLLAEAEQFVQPA